MRSPLLDEFDFDLTSVRDKDIGFVRVSPPIEIETLNHKQRLPVSRHLLSRTQVDLGIF
jgi:hypothetical protein